MSQLPLFPDYTRQYPSTRYQGSKTKLVDWIWDAIKHLDFTTTIDAFGGTGVVSYQFKQQGKQVTYNDYLRFNYHIGRALIENATQQLSPALVQSLFAESDNDNAHLTFITDTFEDIYFTADENRWLDRTVNRIWQLDDAYQQSLAFFALAQAAIVKRPYNLFHRKNLYIRQADVERSFGNKTSWDKPFPEWMQQFVDEANAAVFDNGQTNRAQHGDVFALPQTADLVYLDPPYISGKGVAVDYRDFYHFLEGLTMYDDWSLHVDYQSKHRRLQRTDNAWHDKSRIGDAFAKLFDHFRESQLVVSYRSDGIPSIADLTKQLRQVKKKVIVKSYGNYQYALSTNKKSQEVLLIGL